MLYIAQFPHLRASIVWSATDEFDVISECGNDETSFDTVQDAINYDMRFGLIAKSLPELWSMVSNSPDLNSKSIAQAQTQMADLFDGSEML